MQATVGIVILVGWIVQAASERSDLSPSSEPHCALLAHRSSPPHLSSPRRQRGSFLNTSHSPARARRWLLVCAEMIVLLKTPLAAATNGQQL